MINLVLAIFLSTSVVALFKYLGYKKVNTLQAIAVNYLIAAAFGIWYYQGEETFSTVIHLPWIHMGLIIGVWFVVGFFIFAMSAQKAGVAITGVSSRMSVIVPIAFAVIFSQSEVLTPLKVVGITLVLLSFYLILKKEKGIEINKAFLFLPILLFLVNGINDTLIYYSEHTYLNGSNDIILMLSIVFSTAFIVSIIIVLINIIRGKVQPKWKNLWAGIVLGLLNFGSTFFFFKSLEIFSGTTVFPIQNVGIVSLSAIAGFILYKEKLRLINWIGILTAIAAILIISFSRIAG